MPGRRSITWREAAGERLCLFSDDMQNRRIMDGLAASVGVTLQPQLTANSYLAICSHLRHGDWASIVPHTFFYIFGAGDGLVPIPIVEPVHHHTIGLVLSDRDPQTPVARALGAAVIEADLESDLDERFAAL